MKIHNYLAVKILIITIFVIFNHCQGKQTSVPQRFNTHQWLGLETDPKDAKLQLTPPLLIAGVLCFVTSAISSAGGIEVGALIIPILTIVAGFDLKTASTSAAFMVTGVSLASIFCSIFIETPVYKGKMVIDFDIALLSLPIMLLGVSVGGMCNLVLPEWLIKTLFAIFLSWCSFRTCKSGNRDNKEALNEQKQPLLGDEEKGICYPWMKLGILLLVWLSFVVLYLLRESKNGQNVLHMNPCGMRYWLLSSVQIPQAIILTLWFLYSRKEILEDHDPNRQENEGSRYRPSNLMFQVLALVMGILSGVLGYGCKTHISPLLVLLQVGIAPITVATCSFMMLFTASLSAIQLMLWGKKHTRDALIIIIICFVGLIKMVVQRAIRKHGRASKVFKEWILYSRKKSLEDNDPSRQEIEGSGDRSSNLRFPAMALLMGILCGVFGIGGGMVISPLLIQVGIAPKVTAATCSFMVLLSASMSAVQFWLLGIEHIENAIIFTVICFFGSAIGKIVVQRAIQKHGRASIILFSGGTVMVSSTVIMTSYGALDIWRDYKSGKYMGFKLPC